MLSILKIRPAGRPVADERVLATYQRMRWRALFGVFIGYMAYYFVRSNFTLSTPYLHSKLGFSTSEIGFLSTCMLMAYGLSKGVMSSLADKANPKYYLAFGLILSGIINVFMGFSTAYWMFIALVIANSIFQGMGVAPSFIVIAAWFPRAGRGRIGAFWNISHNIGGGMVAPIAGATLALLSPEHWQGASYFAPAALAIVIAGVVLLLGAGLPYTEGLPPLRQILPETANDELMSSSRDYAPEGMSAWQILRTHVLTNRNVWYVSLADAFVYMVRFGVITWLPLYLLNAKGFSKVQMGVAYAFFEWAAIPSTLLAGYVSDRYFRGRRMPLAIACMAVIVGALLVYWQSTSLLVVGIAAATIGSMIYVPQFLASVQTIDLVPSYAVGSATGLRGLMSYVVGASLGTSLFGILADRFGWHAGFYLLLAGALSCMLFCYLTHRGAVALEHDRNRRNRFARGTVTSAGAPGAISEPIGGK